MAPRRTESMRPTRGCRDEPPNTLCSVMLNGHNLGGKSCPSAGGTHHCAVCSHRKWRWGYPPGGTQRTTAGSCPPEHLRVVEHRGQQMLVVGSAWSFRSLMRPPFLSEYSLYNNSSHLKNKFQAHFSTYDISHNLEVSAHVIYSATGTVLPGVQAQGCPCLGAAVQGLGASPLALPERLWPLPGDSVCCAQGQALETRFSSLDSESAAISEGD